MNKEQEKEFNKFSKSWFPERFASQLLYIDDIRELIEKLLKEEKEEIQGDVETVITLLEANEDRNKIVNFIKEYLIN